MPTSLSRFWCCSCTLQDLAQGLYALGLPVDEETNFHRVGSAPQYNFRHHASTNR